MDKFAINSFAFCRVGKYKGQKVIITGITNNPVMYECIVETDEEGAPVKMLLFESELETAFEHIKRTRLI